MNENKKKNNLEEINEEEVINIRNREYNVNSAFPKRWSPRAMSSEEVSYNELMSLFEAARWAPSSFNEQPWVFLYAKRGNETFEKYVSSLVDFNKIWAKNSAYLIIILSKKNSEHNGNFNITHSFDTGAAWMSLALQGSMNGLVVHGIGGFDRDKLKNELNIPNEYNIEAMAAIGKRGKKELLPKMLQEKEVISNRKLIKEFVYEGDLNGVRKV